MKKVLLLSDHMAQNHIERLTPKGDGICNDCYFTTDVTEQPFDAVVRYHTFNREVEVCVRKGNFFAYPIEYHTGKWDDGNHWVIDNNGDYDYLIGCLNVFQGKPNAIKYIYSEAWFEKTYAYWMNMDIPQKVVEDKVCWITSNAIEMPGHRYRMEFLHAIFDKVDNLNVYGRGFFPMKNKEDILRKYKYVIAFENGFEQYWHTEKILDVWLNYGLPFYYGAEKIHELYPEQACIRIEPNNLEQTVESMQKAIRDKEWERRLPAICEARRMLLHEHNMMYRLANVMHTCVTHTSHVDLTITKNTTHTHRHKFYDKMQKLRKSIWKRRVGYYKWTWDMKKRG